MSEILVLIPDSDPRLRQQSTSVTLFDVELRDNLTSLYEICQKSNGVAIAAPQVGWMERVLVLATRDKPLYMVNPIIMQKSGSAVMSEGCLSYPGQTRNIRRSEIVKVKWRDQYGKMQYGEFTGLEARAVLHETDHLDGKLFIDYEEISNESNR